MLKKTMPRRASWKAFIRTAAICLMANCLLCSAALCGEVVDRVVAVINEDVITLSELEAEAMPAYEKIRAEAPSSQVDEALKNAQRDILRGMIDHKLLIQRAAKRNIEVSSAEIDGAIERILEQNHITVEQFRQQLSSMGLAEEKYRESLRDQILRSKLIGYEIRSKVVITNEQIDAYYRDHYNKNNNPEGYHILQFGSGWNDNGGRSASREEAQKRAEQLREMILAGENFKDIAKNHSDLPSAVDGGDIGTFTKTELADYMWLAIRDLRPGEVSNIIETPSGFQFFRLLSSSSDGVIAQAPLENVREEIRATLYDQELKKKFEHWVKELRENSYIEELL